MPASITYWRDRLKLKLILMARLSRVAISFRAGPRICACAWPPIEKAPLELVLNCWHIRGSHVVHRVENLRPPKKRTWTGLVMAPSTAELYTPGRNINGPKCAHSGLRKKMVSFAEKSGKTAKKSGIRTQSTSSKESSIKNQRSLANGVSSISCSIPIYLTDVVCHPASAHCRL